MRMPVLALAVGIGLGALAPVAHADTALEKQVKSQRSCLLTSTNRPRVAICGANYMNTLLVVNARVVRHPIAVGISRASGIAIPACECGAVKILASANAKSRLTRRKFGDWWRNPKTMAGRRLKGCLKNAALALGALLVHAYATGEWSDREAVVGIAALCGIGAVVDA